MPKLPHPPDVLPDLRASDLRTIPRGTLVWRVHRLEGPRPANWSAFRENGPLAFARFDHHVPGRKRGILYVALHGQACIAEAFQSTRTVHRARGEPWLVAFELERPISVLDLAGRWPTRAGASQAISSGRRDVARAWSRAIHAQYPAVQGIRYPSSMYGRGMCLALYERARGALPRQPVFHQSLMHPGLEAVLARVCADVGYALV